MSEQLIIPPHIGKIKLFVAILATNKSLREYLTDEEAADVGRLHQRFLKYSQTQLDEDLANYIEFAKHYRNVRRLVIWRLRKNGTTYAQIGKVFGITLERVRAICQREERAERRKAL